MRIKKFIAVTVSTMFLGALCGQTVLDYRPQALVKALQKAEITDLSVIEEIVIADSLAEQSHVNGKYFKIASGKHTEYRYIYVGRVNSCRAGGCSLARTPHAEGDSEYFDYYMLFDSSKSVRSVKVFNYQASHGHEITAKGWLSQFVGHDGSEALQVDKNIDAISGATISVYAITADIEKITILLQQID